MTKFGVHSECGKLHTVMVCRPSLAHKRLTPDNCHGLLFDDVIWVERAQKDHDYFVGQMRARGIEVLEVSELLAKVLDDKAGRAWILDRKVCANNVGIGMLAELRALSRRAEGALPAGFVVTPRELFRQMAERTIGQKTARQVRPHV